MLSVATQDLYCLRDLVVRMKYPQWLNDEKKTTLDLFFKLDLTANHREEINAATANQYVV